MASFSIFQHDIGGKIYEVWETDGILQFVIDGEIRHDITSVSDFLVAAAKAINKPNGTDDSIVTASGNVSDSAVQNFHNGGVAFDTNGTSPTIALQDGGTAVSISKAGVGGSLQIDFGAGAEAEAAAFREFSEDLLGKASATEIKTVSGVQMGDFLRTVTVSMRDDDIQQLKFKSTGDAKDKSWADLFIEELAADFGGDQIKNGNVNDLSYSANQLKFAGPLVVDLGSNGVGGKEQYEFDIEEDAQGFFDAVKDAFGPGGDRGAIINSAIEAIAEELGGSQTKNGNVSVNYEARQIKLVGESTVDLGSHGVGGKERYDFANQATAQKFIDLVRDAVGVEVSGGKLVDEFIFDISGGAGISGSPTIVGKDDMVYFMAYDQFGADQVRNGAVSESFSGGARINGTEVTLGPSGVGGKEIWRFDSSEDAVAFVDSMADLFA